MVAGVWARIVRDGDAYAIYSDGDDVPAFRASGLPSEVIALAEVSLGQRAVLALAEEHIADADEVETADPVWPAPGSVVPHSRTHPTTC
jgi:hypothetical protein